MQKIRISSVLCLAAFALAGCANELTRNSATTVIRRALAERAASGMVNLAEGSIDLQVGDVRSISQTDNCHNPASQPLELADLQRYNNARIIHLDRPEPCKWVVTLSPDTQRDVPFDDRIRPPTPRDYNAISIMLSQWSGFQVTEVRQDGMRAEVDATFNYSFTHTMHQLARSQIFPALDSGCAYDIRNSLIHCLRQLPMLFVAGHWKLDLPVIH